MKIRLFLFYVCTQNIFYTLTKKKGYTECHEIEKGCIIIHDFLTKENLHNTLSNITISVTHIKISSPLRAGGRA